MSERPPSTDGAVYRVVDPNGFIVCRHVPTRSAGWDFVRRNYNTTTGFKVEPDVLADDDGPDYDEVIAVAKEMGWNPYDAFGEYNPDVISAAIGEIERRRNRPPEFDNA